jgi:hypothetical protein
MFTVDGICFFCIVPNRNMQVPKFLTFVDEIAHFQLEKSEECKFRMDWIPAECVFNV